MKIIFIIVLSLGFSAISSASACDGEISRLLDYHEKNQLYNLVKTRQVGDANYGVKISHFQGKTFVEIQQVSTRKAYTIKIDGKVTDVELGMKSGDLIAMGLFQNGGPGSTIQVWDVFKNKMINEHIEFPEKISHLQALLPVSGVTFGAAFAVSYPRIFVFDVVSGVMVPVEISGVGLWKIFVLIGRSLFVNPTVNPEAQIVSMNPVKVVKDPKELGDPNAREFTSVRKFDLEIVRYGEDVHFRVDSIEFADASGLKLVNINQNIGIAPVSFLAEKPKEKLLRKIVKFLF